jgi:hypothetical protein
VNAQAPRRKAAYPHHYAIPLWYLGSPLNLRALRNVSLSGRGGGGRARPLHAIDLDETTYKGNAMSTLRWILIGIGLSVTWMLATATNFFDEFGQGQARYEYKLNECTKLATKSEKDGCTAKVKYNRAMGQHDLYGLGFFVNIAFILLCWIVVGFFILMFKLIRWLL